MQSFDSCHQGRGTLSLAGPSQTDLRAFVPSVGGYMFEYMLLHYQFPVFCQVVQTTADPEERVWMWWLWDKMWWRHRSDIWTSIHDRHCKESYDKSTFHWFEKGVCDVCVFSLDSLKKRCVNSKLCLSEAIEVGGECYIIVGIGGWGCCSNACWPAWNTNINAFVLSCVYVLVYAFYCGRFKVKTINIVISLLTSLRGFTSLAPLTS